MNNKKIKDIKKIKDNDNLSYLLTFLDNGTNKTFLVIYNNNCYQIKSIINLIAFVEKYNIVFENNLTEQDLNIIYNLFSLLNTNSSTTDIIKQDSIDNQYYDEEMKVYEK